MRIRALSAVLAWLLLILAATSSCDLVPVETLTKIFEDEYENFWPNLSPDGKYLAFCSDKDDTEYPYFEYDIWCLELDTGELTQLTVNQPEEYFSADMYPCWSADGQWVYFVREYATSQSSQQQLCRVPHTGGEENVEILEVNTYMIDINSTGSQLVVYYIDVGVEYLAVYDVASDQLTPIPGTEGINYRAIKLSPDDTAVWASVHDENKVIIYSLNGDESVEFDYDWSHEPRRISFSPSGNEVLFQFEDNLIRYPIEGGAGEDITPEDMWTVYDGAWMPDGYVYYINQESSYHSDIWRFKP
jgi:Tol biopolymer transport system component